MYRTATLLVSILVLASAAIAAPPNVPRSTVPAQEPGGAHVNRHVDAHVPSRDGAASGDERRDTTRSRVDDPYRTPAAPTPIAPGPWPGQPLRDRRF